MTPSRRQFIGLVGGGVALAGCSGDGNASEPTDSPADDGNGDAVVSMVDTSFDPVTLAVDVGTTVEWVNEDSVGHDVTAAQFHDAPIDWSFAESVSGGGTASHTFESTGIYEYYCTIHGESRMCGAVVVGDASLTESLPCDDGGGGPYS
jgi:plastocyanin